MKNDENLGKEIKLLLDTEVREKTLSLEAIEEVKKIMANNEALTSENIKLKEEIEKQKITISKNVSELGNIKDELGTTKGALNTLKEQEKSFVEMKWKYDFIVARGDEMKEITGMALRNTIISKSRWESGFENVSDSNGFPTNMPTSNSITETETKE